MAECQGDPWPALEERRAVILAQFHCGQMDANDATLCLLRLDLAHRHYLLQVAEWARPAPSRDLLDGYYRDLRTCWEHIDRSRAALRGAKARLARSHSLLARPALALL